MNLIKVLLLTSSIALFLGACSSKEKKLGVDMQTQQQNSKEALKEL